MRYRATVPSSYQASHDRGAHGPEQHGSAPGALQRVAHATRRGLRRATTPSVIRGTAVEIAWTATHVVTYPLGVVEEQVRHPEERLNLDGLDPIKRGLIVGDVENAGTPIILIHGVVDNRSVFTMIKRGLRRRGFGRIITLNYSPLTDDVRVVAERLEALVEALCIDTGYERVHVIGHSMGGLVARYFVQRMGGDSRVHTLVTLGTPHQGTAPAKLVPHPVARQMRPGSDILTELAAPSPGCRTRFVAVWSDLDQMIIPKPNARIEHPDLMARNVFVPSVGHNSLPVDGRVVHEVCTTLAHVDQDGSTVAEGATSIASAASRQGRTGPTRDRR
jgi:triacylglycerol lipase